MSYQERNIYASIISTIVVTIFYALRLFNMDQLGLLSGPDAASSVGKMLILLVIALVVGNILLKMLFAVIFSILQKDCETPPIDERDKMIELKGVQISYAIFGAGLISTMSALAMNWVSLGIAINLIVFSIICGETLGNILKAFHYRRGY